MELWQIISVPICLIVIGLFRQLWIIRRKRSSLDLANQFLEKFTEWCNGRAQDRTLYNWMLNKSETVQTMLGGSGLVNYQPGCANYMHRNYPIILNEIPGIQKDFFDDILTFNSIAVQELNTRIQMVDGCLRRYIGLTQEQFHHERNRLLNPLVLFCGGVAWLLEFPLFILSESNIISSNRRTIVVNGRAFSLLSGIVSVATLIATIMTIVMGWDQLTSVLSEWIK